MQRLAVTFRVKPGTEDAVRQLLATYEPPVQEIDENTRLISTSVFMRGGVVVRMIEFEGAFPRVMAHLSQEKSIQQVERELDNYLVDEDKRDMSTPEGARAFFQKAMMETVTTRIPAGYGAQR